MLSEQSVGMPPTARGQPGSFTVPYITPPANPLSAHDETVLSDHVDKVQSLFLDMVDHQLIRVYKTLEERERELDQAEVDRKKAMVDLGKAWCEVDRVNNILASLTERLNETAQSEVISGIEKVAAIKEAQKIEVRNAQLQEDVKKATAELGEAAKRMDQLRQINMAFTEDLKVQKRIQNKLKKEREYLDRKRQDMESEMSLMQKKMDQVITQNKELIKNLAEQQNETRVAQNAISRMSNEINKSTQVRQALEKQWEDAINAMSKRDATMFMVEKAKQHTAEELQVAQMALRNTEMNHKQTCADLEAQKNELDDVKRTLDSTSTELSKTRTELAHARSETRLAQDTLTQASERLQDEQRARQRAEAEVDRLKNQVALMHAKLNIRSDKLGITANEEFASKVLSEQEQRTQKEVTAAAKERDRAVETSSKVQYENAEMVVAIQELRDLLTAKETELALLHSKNKEVTKAAENLCYESQMLSYRLEKKDMELSTLRASQQSVDTRPLEISLKNLEKELQSIKIERDQVQSSWVKIQQANSRLEHQVAQLQAENNMLKTKGVINQTASNHATDAIKEMKRESFEKSMKMTQLHVELQKLRPRMKELEERNAVQEAQLAQYALALEESACNTQTSIHLLKHDLRRVSRDKSMLNRTRLTEERAFHVLEQKLQLTCEILEKTRQDKVALQKQNTELKQRCDAWAQRVDEVKTQWRKLAEMGEKRVKRGHPGQLHIGDDTSLDYEIIDVPGLKLRNETVTLENKHLAEEVELLNGKITELENAKLTLESTQTHLAMQLRASENQMNLSSAALTGATQRAVRAEQLSAFLEVQLKEAKPNARIDYAVVQKEEFTPSPALQSMFLKQPSVKMPTSPESTGNTGPSVGGVVGSKTPKSKLPPLMSPSPLGTGGKTTPTPMPSKRVHGGGTMLAHNGSRTKTGV